MVSSTLTLSGGLNTSAIMQSENHLLAATLVIIGSGKDLVDAKATGEGFLGDQDLTQLGRITPQLA